MSAIIHFNKDLKMHYNQFTIDYIKAVKNDLKIEFNAAGNAIYFPDIITHTDILNLKSSLQQIWCYSSDAICLLERKYDAKIQSGLFGLVNDLDIALKVGFLLGDRVVLVDYLFERLLLRKEESEINLIHLGVIASSLVNALALAEAGRIVIIPNPFNWNPDSKKIIREVSRKTEISIDLMSLLNMLSITKKCQLHPYTVAESHEVYSSIINSQIDNVDAIGKDGGAYAYAGILGALLSEKLLNETELKIALDIPLSKYFATVSANENFYSKYLSYITDGGSLNAQNNIDNLRRNLLIEIEHKNRNTISSIIKLATIVTGFGGGTIALASAMTVVAAPLQILGAALSLSATLTGSVNSEKKEEQPIISVFHKLYNGQ